jgi:hypothetical protein
MRKKLLYIGYQMGYELPRNDEEKDSRSNELCFQHVNAWVKEHGAIKKHINYMTYNELCRTVSQFEIVYRNFLNKQAKPIA